MYRFFQYLRHLLLSRHTYGFGVHSPAIYAFLRDVVYEKNPYYAYAPLERERERLLQDSSAVYVEDYGMGQSGNRTIRHIARTSLASTKEAQLLFRIANYQKANHVLELGTSLGLTTAYLASWSKSVRVVTFEGSRAVAQRAQALWKKLGLSYKIKQQECNISDYLPLYLQKHPCLYDLVFIDANHSLQATLDYFQCCMQSRAERAVFVIDDIYHSRQMQQAWQQIQQEPAVRVTIDLYWCGIVFFDPHLNKGHYTCWF